MPHIEVTVFTDRDGFRIAPGIGEFQFFFQLTGGGEYCDALVVGIGHKNSSCLIKFQFVGELQASKAVSDIEGAGYYSPYDARIYKDSIYVVDRDRYRILVLNFNFELQKIIEKAASGRFYFNYPQHIDFDSEGRLYVMDTNTNSIKVIHVNDGTLLATLVHEDIGPSPALALDDDDRIYISGSKRMSLDHGVDRYTQSPYPGIHVFEKIQFFQNSK